MIKLKKLNKIPNCNRNVFEVRIKFEHGDARHAETKSVFVEKFEDVAKLLYDLFLFKTKFDTNKPEEFDDFMKSNGSECVVDVSDEYGEYSMYGCFDPVQDCYSMNRYASISGIELYFIDSVGDVYPYNIYRDGNDFNVVEVVNE